MTLTASRARRLAGLLPGLDDVCEEPLAAVRCFRKLLLTAVRTVEADGGGADHGAHGVGLGGTLSQKPGRTHA